MKLREIIEDCRYNKVCTFLVECMGITEIFTDMANLLKNWGEEVVAVRFLNTRELQVIVQ